MMPKELSVLLRLHHNARYWLYVTNSLALAVFHDAQLQQYTILQQAAHIVVLAGSEER